MAISDNIKKLRLEAGLSQEQLAQRIGKTRSAVSYYESGRIIPRMGAIENMAQVFGVPKSQIIESVTYSYVSLPEPSANERRLLEAFRKLSPKAQEAFLNAIEASLE